MAESEITLMEAIENIALTDPLSTALFLLGGLITGVSVLVLGGLAAGAAADLVMRE